MSYESMIREGENEVDIVIIDDEPKIRNGLRHFLDKQEGWSVTGAFENAVDALAFLSHHDADAVITDIKKMMRGSGAMNAVMSGSGPSIFGVFLEEETAQAAAVYIDQTLRTKGMDAQVNVTGFYNRDS